MINPKEGPVKEDRSEVYEPVYPPRLVQRERKTRELDPEELKKLQEESRG